MSSVHQLPIVSNTSLQSGSGPSPSEVQPPSLPPVHEVSMGDNEEYQEITEG